MNEVCRFLHKELSKMPRHRAGFDPEGLPKNGLYFLFEKGEAAHDGERIVRVGTHTGQNNLPKRLNEHLFALNKDRSIFRKHIGRCLLSRRNDPFLAAWEIDLTTRLAREKSAHLVDTNRLAEVEKEVSDYINDSFSFTILRIDDKTRRMAAEHGALCTIAMCAECTASDHWLGAHHPNSVIRESGLWNVQGLHGRPLGLEEAGILIAGTHE